MARAQRTSLAASFRPLASALLSAAPMALRSTGAMLSTWRPQSRTRTQTSRLCAIITNARVRGRLKKTEIVANSGNFIWNGDSLNGYPTIVSNQVPKNWHQRHRNEPVDDGLRRLLSGPSGLLVWSGLTGQPLQPGHNSGAVRVTAFQDCRRPGQAAEVIRRNDGHHHGLIRSPGGLRVPFLLILSLESQQ